MARQGWAKYEDRSEWLAARRGGIGSSDAASVLGASRYASALDRWREKVGLAEEQPDNRFTKAGRFLEPAVAAWFEEETGLDTYNPGDYAVFWDRNHPNLYCTPDRIIPEPMLAEKEACGLEDTVGDGVLEIKTASAWRVDEWGDAPPLHYQVQVQHQLACMDLKWGIIAVLVGGNDFRWFRIDRNERFINAMRAKLLYFWATYVVPEIEPPAEMPKDLKTWETLHPGFEGDEIDLPAVLIPVDERIQEIKAEEKALAKERKSREAAIKHAMGDAVIGRLPNGVGFSYRTIQIAAKRIERKASSYRKLNRRKPK